MRFMGHCSGMTGTQWEQSNSSRWDISLKLYFIFHFLGRSAESTTLEAHMYMLTAWFTLMHQVQSNHFVQFQFYCLFFITLQDLRQSRNKIFSTDLKRNDIKWKRHTFTQRAMCMYLMFMFVCHCDCVPSAGAVVLTEPLLQRGLSPHPVQVPVEPAAGQPLSDSLLTGR